MFGSQSVSVNVAAFTLYYKAETTTSYHFVHSVDNNYFVQMDTCIVFTIIMVRLQFSNDISYDRLKILLRLPPKIG